MASADRRSAMTAPRATGDDAIPRAELRAVLVRRLRENRAAVRRYGASSFNHEASLRACYWQRVELESLAAELGFSVDELQREARS